MCETELWGCHHINHNLTDEHTDVQTVSDIPSVLTEMKWDLSINSVTWEKAGVPPPTLYWSCLWGDTDPRRALWSYLTHFVSRNRCMWTWECHARSKWSYDLWTTWKTGKKQKESRSLRIATVCKEGSAKPTAKPILMWGEECQLTLFRNTGLYDKYEARWSLMLVSRWLRIRLTGMKAPFSLLTVNALITSSKALNGTSSDTQSFVLSTTPTLC